MEIQLIYRASSLHPQVAVKINKEPGALASLSFLNLPNSANEGFLHFAGSSWRLIKRSLIHIIKGPSGNVAFSDVTL